MSVVLAFVLLSSVGISALLYRQLHAVEGQLASTTTLLTTLQSSFELYRTEGEKKDSLITDEIRKHAETIDALTENIEGFDSTVGKLSGSVKTLEKLTTTDPELLQKYSKIYFLNENYKPSDLATIKEEYDLVNGKEVTVHTEARSFLHTLLKEAIEDGVDIMVLSGYRSFSEQTTLKSAYTTRYGTGANQFSADQGYSEHQLGTAVDFTTKEAGEELALFKDSAAYAWLQEHAHQYGFVLSYPEGNTFYSYEPWHWRFVGKDLATHLHKKNLHFYDLEQREIDTYIPTLFDK